MHRIASRHQGFTLIELMIVISILGVLATIAIPKFANLIRKSREGATKGNLGSIRSAITIYYANNEGVFPTWAPEKTSSVLEDSLIPRYIRCR